MGVKRLLNIGCGPKGGTVIRDFQAYKEVRLDADKEVQPDIQASIIAMPMVEDESFDGVWASHVIEHLYFHEVALALAEVYRVLNKGGKFIVQVPDLQSIGSAIALDKPDTAVYVGGIGPVAPLDMLYGHRGQVAQGKLYMAHRTGFTASVLEKCLKRAGFTEVQISRDMKFDLKATALKGEANALRDQESEGRLQGRPQGAGQDLQQKAPVPSNGGGANESDVRQYEGCVSHGQGWED